MLSVQNAITIRQKFHDLGYKQPDTEVSRTHNQLLKKHNLAEINPNNEAVILHLKIANRSALGFFFKLFVSGTSKLGTTGIFSRNVHENKLYYIIKDGEIFVTNHRIIGFNPLINEIHVLNMNKIKRIEYDATYQDTLLIHTDENENEIQFVFEFPTTGVFDFTPSLSSAESFKDYVAKNEKINEHKVLASASKNLRNLVYYTFLSAANL